ncbi:MAG: MFS transporter [Anaerolineae bacterium]|nr:MFS transporter [Anaerolineae bacterium]
MARVQAPALTPAVREKIYRRNFVFFLIDNVLFSVALSIISSTTVVPDFVRRLTDSEILIGLSGSLFMVGFTLPQLFIAHFIVRHERKKWWFVGPNIPVRFVILIFAGITAWLGGDHLELVLVVFFICYSIAAFGDGLVGVPWADLAGTSLDNRWRARMFGLTSAVTGVLMLLIAPLIGSVLGNPELPFPNNYAVLFGAAGVVFVISILPGLFFHELPGGKAVEKRPSLGEFLPQLGHLLRDDVPFRSFIVLRIFTSLFLMAAPFYVGYATVELGLSSDVAVPALLAMQTLGTVGGALVYTWLGARSNLTYMRLALSSAVLLPICAVLAGVVGPLPLYAGFLLSGLAASGNLMSSYLNWIVGYASPDQRPIYVGLSNTVAAVISFVAPIIGGVIAQSFGYQPLFLVSLVMAVGALVVTLRNLRETPAEQPPEVAVDSIPA